MFQKVPSNNVFAFGNYCFAKIAIYFLDNLLCLCRSSQAKQYCEIVGECIHIKRKDTLRLSNNLFWQVGSVVCRSLINSDDFCIVCFAMCNLIGVKFSYIRKKKKKKKNYNLLTFSLTEI